MYKNPLTKGQKAQNFSESVSRDLIEGLKQKRGTLDMSQQDFARSLGIDPQKPTEIYNVIGDLEDAGTVWYNGWYYVCGTVLALPESFQERKQNDNYLLENGYLPDRDLPFLVLPMLRQDLLHEEFPLPAIQLFVDTHLPYVLPCAYTRQVRTIIVEDPRE